MRADYDFDELALLPGCEVYAYGTATIDFTVGAAEPDVGYMHDYVEEWRIVAIDVGRILSPEELLYRMIEAALSRDDCIERACQRELDQC